MTDHFRIEIREGGENGQTFDVTAASVEAAAQIAVRRIARLTRPVQVHARRVTGDHGLSGVFQGYRQLPTPEHAETSSGPTFHVMPTPGGHR